MRTRGYVLFAMLFIVSLGALAVGHYLIEPAWKDFPLLAVEGSGGLFWQVQSTFLSVGFASLAIAAQLFAEAPLAIGASRGRVFSHVGAERFVAAGLVANIAIATEAVWMPSSVGIIAVVAPWFIATIFLLVRSTVKLMELFGRPSLLDTVVARTLTTEIAARVETAGKLYERANRDIERLFVSEEAPLAAELRGRVAFRVRAPDNSLVLKAVRPALVRRAISELAPRTTEGNSTTAEDPEPFIEPRIHCDLAPGDRLRTGQHAFRVEVAPALSETTRNRVTALLLESLVFEHEDTITAVEESLRDVSSLRDTIGTAVRTGAFATAERALRLLGTALRGVWLSAPEDRDILSASRSQIEELLRAGGDVEQDVTLSPRVASIFIDAAMKRAVEAGRVGNVGYVEECLRSFTRMWSDVLRYGGDSFEPVRSRIVTCMVTLAAYVYSGSDVNYGEKNVTRAIWAFVHIVKLAIDAKCIPDAVRAAEELGTLFEYREEGDAREQVRAGQLVLSAWCSYLAAATDDRDPSDSVLPAALAPRGTLIELLQARKVAGRGESPFSRWEWWELRDTSSVRAQSMEMSGYVDRELVKALVSAGGPLPDAADDETAADYQRFVSLLSEAGSDPSDAQARLKAALQAKIDEWELSEDRLLAVEAISEGRLQAVRDALRNALEVEPRIVNFVPRKQALPVPEEGTTCVDDSLPILGMNLLIPRMFLVDRVFKQTYADPSMFGSAIATGFTDGEDRRVADGLRALSPDPIQLTVAEIRDAIAMLDEHEAKHHVLFKPYGGVDDLQEWYDADMRKILDRITVIETAVLDQEAFLFDPRTTLLSRREPEEKAGLDTVEGTTISLGVFDDAKSEGEPQVRIETGEYFVVWAGEDPRVIRFGNGTESPLGSD